MFYLRTHSTHFIYGYMASDIQTIQIAREETRCRHIGYSFQLAAKVLLYAPSLDRIEHSLAFVTSVVEHWLDREIAQSVNHEGSIWQPIAPWANAFTTELHLSPRTYEVIEKSIAVCYISDIKTRTHTSTQTVVS